MQISTKPIMDFILILVKSTNGKSSCDIPNVKILLLLFLKNLLFNKTFKFSLADCSKVTNNIFTQITIKLNLDLLIFSINELLFAIIIFLFNRQIALKLNLINKSNVWFPITGKSISLIWSFLTDLINIKLLNFLVLNIDIYNYI